MDFLLPPSGAGGGKLSKKKGKSSGLDGAFLRKERELKYFRIQKDRRVLQTNRMRKEVDSHHGKSQSNSNNDNNEEDEGEDSDHDMIEQDEKKENSFIKSENTRNTPPYYSQRLWKKMNEMKELFYHHDHQQQLVGAIYFRKLLATDKAPPIQDVISLGFLPRIIELLRDSLPRLQFEICWILTNMACGKPGHVQLMIENEAIPCLMSMLLHQQDDVRDQSVWALANISGHPEISKELLLEIHILDFCLEYLNIDPAGQILSGYPIAYTPPWGQRMSFPSPSLFVMQHFTNLFANIVRDKPLPSPHYIHQIILMSFELYQSPDESILISISLYFSSIIQDDYHSIDYLNHMMERGLLSRLHELCLNTTVRWSAVHLLCSILKAESSLHHHLVLRKKYNFLEYILLELNGHSTISQSELGNENLALVNICTAISTTILVSPNSTYSDTLYSSHTTSTSLCPILLHLIATASSEVSSAAGRCLCYLITHVSPQFTIEIGKMIIPHVITSLLASSYDLDLLLCALTALLHIINCSYQLQIHEINFHDANLHELISQMAMGNQFAHNSNISQLAGSILEILDGQSEN